MMNTLILGQSNLGKAVFANKNFKKGDVITTFPGKLLDYDEIDDNSYEDEHCVQIGKRIYLGSSGKFCDFINHSCNPNSGLRLINKKLKLIASRNIDRGEEIMWDYSTSMNEDHWEMDCMCKNRNCRKRIKDFKYLPKKVQQKYMKLGIVPKYIIENLKQTHE